MKERMVSAFDKILTENQSGEMKNLLITDNDATFLEDALHELRYWASKKSIHLVEIDERDDSWLFKHQSKELFDELNHPNTVLLVKNYATSSSYGSNKNTARSLLRNIALHRCYTCSGDFLPDDKLSNLLFVVAINDLSEMKWRSDEYMTFSTIHQDNSKMVWTNTNFALLSSKMHPVMSAVNKILFWVSPDETTLCVDVGEAFRGFRCPRHHFTADDRSEMIHTFIESNLPDFRDHVVCLILKNNRFEENERFVINGKRLKKSFPNLGSICHKDNFEIVDSDEVCILDPFDLGEMSFYLALDDDIPMANTFLHDLWALDHKWARFFCGIAKDFCRKPEDHAKFDPDSAVHNWTGMDHLFHIYLLGWYHAGDDFFDEEDKVYVNGHKNFDKALDLLKIRFQNCSIDEVANKLYWDIKHLKQDIKPDYLRFAQVLEESEKICPGVLAKMHDNGWIIEDCECFFPIRTCNMCGKTFDYWDHEENISFDHFIGYGSIHDMHRIQLNLCCKCFDKVVDWIVPQCEVNPMTEYQ